MTPEEKALFYLSEQDRRTLIEKVGNPRVQRKEWYTPYHFHLGWNLFEKLPPSYQALYDEAVKNLNPTALYEGEGYIHESDGEVDLFTFALNARGSPNINTPLFGDPTLNMKKIMPNYLIKAGHDRVLHEEHPDLLKPKRGHKFVPVMLWANVPPGQEIDYTQPPTYTAGMYIFPFYFYKKDRDIFKAVGNDPFRVMFELAIETAHLHGAPPTMLKYSGFAGDIIGSVRE